MHEQSRERERERERSRRKRRSEERITRPKRRKFIIWNRGILTSYLFLCVRHARLALTNLKLIGNSFRTLSGNFKIFGNLFGTLRGSLWNLCVFLFFFFFASLTKLSSCFSHRSLVFVLFSSFNSSLIRFSYSPCFCSRLYFFFHRSLAGVCVAISFAPVGFVDHTLFWLFSILSLIAFGS